MNTEEVTIQSGKLILEGILHIPEGSGPFPAVVMCHPHPQFGGSMDNYVVEIICDALASSSILSLRFNLRGVGHSQGNYDQGIGEQDDIRSAFSFLNALKQVNNKRTGLAGYSAGAAWGISATCSDEKVKALALISLPLSMITPQSILNCQKPKLLISGSNDSIIPVKALLAFYEKLSEPKDFQIVDGADHSWWWFEATLSEKVVEFFQRAL